MDDSFTPKIDTAHEMSMMPETFWPGPSSGPQPVPRYAVSRLTSVGPPRRQRPPPLKRGFSVCPRSRSLVCYILEQQSREVCRQVRSGTSLGNCSLRHIRATRVTDRLCDERLAWLMSDLAGVHYFSQQATND